jgi:hypothetical protein
MEAESESVRLKRGNNFRRILPHVLRQQIELWRVIVPLRGLEGASPLDLLGTEGEHIAPWASRRQMNIGWVGPLGGWSECLDPASRKSENEIKQTLVAWRSRIWDCLGTGFKPAHLKACRNVLGLLAALCSYFEFF